MALPGKMKLNDLYIEEYLFYQSVVQNPLRSTSGSASYTNPRTLNSYSVLDGGQSALALYMFETNPNLKLYTFDDNTYSELKGTIDQLDYQTPTVVGTQIRVTKPSSLNVIRFRLSTPVTGTITISTDGGTSSIALKDGEGNQVTELQAGLVEVFYDNSFFILRSGGGIKSFFGDGSDGTIPNLNLVTTAPNGGTVSNLWDMNAGTVFTTGTLSSASDQVVFSIDFGKPFLLVRNNTSDATQILFDAKISTGATRVLTIQYSNNGIDWTDTNQTMFVSTSGGNYYPNVTFNISARFFRYVLKAGGSSCTFSCQGYMINGIQNPLESQTTKVFRILEPSTLNGSAVIKQYTSYNLPVGYEHTVQNPCQGLIIYSQGGVTVNGIIDMSQKAGLAPNGNPIPMIIAPSYIKTAKTSSLLHFDNNITDDNGRVWTNNGAATFDATNKKFGTHAISFNGTNQYLTTPVFEFMDFLNEDFTIDFWIRPTSITGSRGIFGTTNGFAFTIVGSEIRIDNHLTVLFTTSGAGIQLNTFQHITLIRDNNKLKLFKNGVLIYEYNYGVNFLLGLEPAFLGTDGEGNYFAGQIDEFRIIKGKAMYTSNFTPPTSAYTYQATYSDEVEAFKEYYQMTTRLQMLRGGYGGSSAGYGGGYSGSTGRQTSVGIGGAGRQNLGGFGGGGSSGNVASGFTGGIGGSILNSEIGGGSVVQTISNTVYAVRVDGVNGGGAISPTNATISSAIITAGICFGGGGGGMAPVNSTANGNNGQYAGGFLSVICKGNFLNTGIIKANGGAGGNGMTATISNTGGGGSGSGSGGGVIAIFNKGTYTNSGTLQANGGSAGTAGAGSGTGEAGGIGSSGSIGQIQLTQL